MARHGVAWQGVAWQGKDRGRARHGLAWRGRAWLGRAWLGRARIKAGWKSHLTGKGWRKNGSVSSSFEGIDTAFDAQ